MCGRYSLTSPPELLVGLFGLTPGQAIDWSPRFNIAPTQRAPVVRLTREGDGRKLVEMTWGLVPWWSEDRSIGARTINARSETAATKPAFRDAWRRRRCLVPASGFYEWRKLGRVRQPYYVRHVDGAPIAYAGLWDRWKSKDGDEVLDTYTILTTEPNDRLRALHDRMPVILPPERFDAWLDPAETDDDRLRGLLRPAPDEDLEIHQVSRLVNSPANDEPACIEPIDEPIDDAAGEPDEPDEPTLFG